MTLGAAQILAGRTGWRIDRQPGPDLAALVIGRPVEEVAALLPRLYNLCRMAQSTAACLALGLPCEGDPGAEVIRDHLARIFVTLRRAFGMAPLRPDVAGVFGPAGHLPRNVGELSGWLTSDLPAAELARAVVQSFSAGMAVCRPLPAPQGTQTGAFENSPAGRQAAHPLLRAIEADQGRSPLWRYLGMLADLEAALAGQLPAPRCLPGGTAIVQAARGAYALRLDQSDGRVTTMLRVTPTDHQLAPGGALEQALAGLPAQRPDLALRLIALHDPCIPVTLAEPCHA
ncbi:hydrogenase expression/formation protein HupK [Frigidibacter albus]|uniref:Hydrogenase expression/formation protein HupK n=1 Tax=Frigidibacter albus TaxID=1465486 RepID=A0A6L8VBW5_9RHOB|nr:hydrogenase expression/formation protein HupK [Frigidibacter albus]MZQ87785.1 hydrogenase expression/formation protein HupK [Frigidibacter albus]NBE29691.1 hydrogenase expression/formation protein HupK [Frigidibacter albus]GGH43305.1 HupK protein [Frigidibacter albus]